MKFLIKAHPYPYEVAFSFGEKVDKICKRLKKNGIKTEEVKDSFKNDDFDGWFCRFPEKNLVLIRMLKKPTTPYQISVLSHEILHCVIYIMNSVGITLTPESEEAYTYLQGHLMEEVLNKTK